MEGVHLLLPHMSGKGLLGLECFQVGPSLVQLALSFVGFPEGSLGNLLSQNRPEFGGKAVSEVLELSVAGSGRDGEVGVEQVVDEWIPKSREDRERGG